MKINPHNDRVPSAASTCSHHATTIDSNVDRHDAMINDLIQLTRLQNNEINSLRQQVQLISASAATAAEREQDLRDEVNELQRQVSALLQSDQQQQQQQQQKQQQDEKGWRKKQQQQSRNGNTDDGSGTATPPMLTRRSHVAIRASSQTVRDSIIAAVKEDVTAQTLELEQKQDSSMSAVKKQVRDLEVIMSTVLSGIGALYQTLVPKSDIRDKVSSVEHCYYHHEQTAAQLRARVDVDAGDMWWLDLSSMSKQQILLSHQFSALATALASGFGDIQKEIPVDMQKQLDKLSRTVDRQFKVISNQNTSIVSHGEEINKIHICLSSLQPVLESFQEARHEESTLRTRLLDLEQKVEAVVPPHSPAWSSSAQSTLYPPSHQDSSKITDLTSIVDSHEKDIYDLGQRLLAVETTSRKHKNSLFSDCKDLLNLQKRLSYAEKMIGGAYSPTYFTVRGQSFYQDAAALRYAPTTTDNNSNGAAAAPLRTAFSKFYGNRADVVRFVDIAPPVVMLAFYAIARVRCSHEIWEGKEEKLELKQEIRRVAEGMVDSWVKVLPLREGDEHLPCHDRALMEDGNHLRLLCRRACLDIGT